MSKPFRPPTDSRKTLPTLEDFIKGKGILSPFDMVRANHCMKDNQVNFGTALQFLGILSADVLGKYLRENFSVHKIEIDGTQIQSRYKSLIPGEKAKAWQSVPINLIDDSGQKILLVGMTDPLDAITLRKIETTCHIKVQPAFIALDDLQSLLKRYYRLGLELFPPEITAFGEVTVKRRMEAVTLPSNLRSVGKAKISNLSKEVSVLVELLVKKGVLTWEEFEKALQA